MVISYYNAFGYKEKLCSQGYTTPSQQRSKHLARVQGGAEEPRGPDFFLAERLEKTGVINMRPTPTALHELWLRLCVQPSRLHICLLRPPGHLSEVSAQKDRHTSKVKAWAALLELHRGERNLIILLLRRQGPAEVESSPHPSGDCAGKS